MQKALPGKHSRVLLTVLNTFETLKLKTTTRTSKHLISCLSHKGLPKQFFSDILDRELIRVHSICTDRACAYQELKRKMESYSDEKELINSTNKPNYLWNWKIALRMLQGQSFLLCSRF
jgi:hypothetical protein